MTPPKSRYTDDPFLTAVAEQPRQRLLTRSQAAGFLGIGLTTLDDWRSRKLPPPYVDLRGMVRYKCGDLIDFVDSLPTSQLTPVETAVAGNSPLQAVPAGDLQRIGMYAPVMRGGRRKKQITSFAGWLAEGDPAGPPWRFAMVDDLGSQYPRRPINLVATLEFDLADEVLCVKLTMLEYARALAEYVQAVENLAMT